MGKEVRGQNKVRVKGCLGGGVGDTVSNLFYGPTKDKMSLCKRA